jgi:hypothetical protein
VGSRVGEGVGRKIGTAVGEVLGAKVGYGVGGRLGCALGICVGGLVGARVVEVGSIVNVGSKVGDGLGCWEGRGTGSEEGAGVGIKVGRGKGLSDGPGVGAEGLGVGTCEETLLGWGDGGRDTVGCAVGSCVGKGELVGAVLGSGVGLVEGTADGGNEAVGAADGEGLGLYVSRHHSPLPPSQNDSQLSRSVWSRQ